MLAKKANSSIQLAKHRTHLFEAGLEEMPEVLDGVMPVLVEGPQQLLQALLHPVGVGRALVQRVGEAGHRELLLLVDLGDDALLVHGLEMGILV